jgi:hypothetical protein
MFGYASEDRARVAPIVEFLKTAGFSVWWDRSLLAGKAFNREIEIALNEARCVIVLWSAASVRSDWVLAEAEEARRRNVLIPVLIDDVKPPLIFRILHEIRLVGPPTNLPGTDKTDLIHAVANLVKSSGPQVDSEHSAAPQTEHTRSIRVGRWAIVAGVLVAMGSTWYVVSSYRNKPIAGNPPGEVVSFGDRATLQRIPTEAHNESPLLKDQFLGKQARLGEPERIPRTGSLINGSPRDHSLWAALSMIGTAVSRKLRAVLSLFQKASG